jgi:hypothetical protein
MKILFDEQDLMDSVHVFIAAKHNRGYVEGSEPHHVKDVRLFFHEQTGFTASGSIHGFPYSLSQQEVIDAVALYLSSYYSFAADRLLINLSWDEETRQFSADIVVNR